MSAPDPIAERIRKLLALAESPNEHEAALAAERAQTLLLKLGLDVAEVMARTGDGGSIATEKSEFDGPMAPWQRALAGAVATSVGGELMTKGARRGTFTFYGPAGTTAGAVAMYQYLAERLERFANVDSATRRPAGVHARTYKTSYLWGAVDRIACRLQERREALEAEAKPGAVVLIKGAAKRRMEAEHPDLRSDRIKPAIHSPDAFVAGHETANNLPLGDTEIGGRRRELPA